jgi:hypothetical protein
MAQEKRSTYSAQIKKDVGTGPYLARIIGHLDPSFMGGLEVMLLRDTGNTPGEETQTYPVKCASPFFGYTGFEFMGKNTASVSPQGEQKSSTQEAYNDTQKSYGMWMVPPDVGVTVLVIFINGDPSQGYWIGCIPPNFANNMVPAIAGSKQVDYDENDKRRFNTDSPLPVAEINKRLNKVNSQTDPKSIKKPLHPIAERFLEQGLLEDDVRGTTTTSARREIPSMVFGISTPGPRDKRSGAKKSAIGTKDHQQNSFVSRLGGTQFVMDDGDERFVRATPAGQGPVKYINVLEGTDAATGEKVNEKGNPTLPLNEYFRIRTRTGHQLLMHNTEDLIYIGNSRGTTWIELTSNGKIDIYAQDSISIHTENDLNVRADRDINMEAGRNINMKAISGRIQMEAGQDWNVLVGNDAKITVSQNFDLTAGSNTKLTTGSALDISSGEKTKLTAGSGLDIGSGGPTKVTSNGTLDIGAGGNIVVSGPRVDINGPAAEPAEIADSADTVSPLNPHINPSSRKSAGWTINKYQSGTVQSIMKRIPMHEPWPLHENFAPQTLNPSDTDRET